MAQHAPEMPKQKAAKDPRPRGQLSLPVRMAIAWLTNAILLWAVVAALHNASAKNVGTLLLAAVVYGVLNTFLKPILRFVTLPLAVLSFGVVWFFVSLLMLVLTKDIVSGFHIHGFWTYVSAGLIIWIVNLALDLTPGPWQLTGKRRRRTERAQFLRLRRS